MFLLLNNMTGNFSFVILSNLDKTLYEPNIKHFMIISKYLSVHLNAKLWYLNTLSKNNNNKKFSISKVYIINANLAIVSTYSIKIKRRYIVF